jgi:hypothetical protein
MVEAKIMQIFIQKIIPHASPEEKAFNSCVTLFSVLPDRVLFSLIEHFHLLILKQAPGGM